MRHALELGVNWTDMAAVYGLGHSEEVVGRLLRERPSERPIAFTQVCFAATREIPSFASTGFMLRSPCGGRLSYRRELDCAQFTRAPPRKADCTAQDHSWP
jgi:aryl-alcohol dehydrogenase-like predicted oxidoreductase